MSLFFIINVSLRQALTDKPELTNQTDKPGLTNQTDKFRVTLGFSHNFLAREGNRKDESIFYFDVIYVTCIKEEIFL